MSKLLRSLLVVSALSSITACVMEEDELGELDEALFSIGRSVPLKLAISSGFTCPNGQPAVEISGTYCQDPVLVGYTAYWCKDATGKDYLAKLDLFKGDAMQTEACSSTIEMPEKGIVFAPTKYDLNKRFDRIYPADFVNPKATLPGKRF